MAHGVEERLAWKCCSNVYILYKVLLQ